MRSLPLPSPCFRLGEPLMRTRGLRPPRRRDGERGLRPMDVQTLTCIPLQQRGAGAARAMSCITLFLLSASFL